MRSLLLAAALSVSVCTGAQAATFTVTSGANSGAGTLRQAITSANGTGGADTIEFQSTPVDVVIDTPLPAITAPVEIDGSGSTTALFGTVAGSASYVSTQCSNANSWALDLTAPAAVGSRVRYLPFLNVCGRAIKSNIVSPTINIGPRRADGTLSISGAAGGGIVDFYGADSVPNSGEADTFLRELTVGAGGTYSFVSSPEPVPGQFLTATTTDSTSTSTFAARTKVPDDIVSPALTNAVAVSNTRIRLDFNEGIAPGSLAPAEFALTIAGLPRPVTAVGVAGNSVFLDTTLGWLSGEGGSVALTGTGRVADLAGNEVLGLPSATVFAGPGELTIPEISSFRFAPSRFCQRKSAGCRRGTSSVIMTLNKPARVVFTVIRGRRARTLVSFVRRLKQGRNRFKFDAVVSGRTLPASTLGLRAYAEDVARTRSAEVDAAFRVVKRQRDL